VKRAGALLAGIVLAGCGSDSEEPAPQPTQAVVEGPRTLVSETIGLETLGPRIVGPEGDVVESDIPGLGTMVSYVACPADIESDTCDHSTLPDDTIYTYVHTVTLDPTAAEQASDQWGGARLFRTIEPPPGFSFSIGYDGEQALGALGEGYNIQTQIEDGALIWRIAASDGWMPGETLTFYWRSSQPPAGPAEAFSLEAEGLEGTATGPFPEEEEEAGADAEPS
jgi:hypothetical protein